MGENLQGKKREAHEYFVFSIFHCSILLKVLKKNTLAGPARGQRPRDLFLFAIPTKPPSHAAPIQRNNDAATAV